MKTTSVLAITAVAALCLTGCSGHVNPVPKTGKAPTTAEAPVTPPSAAKLNAGDDCTALFVGPVTMLSEREIANAATHAEDYLICSSGPGKVGTNEGNKPVAKLAKAQESFGFQTSPTGQPGTVYVCQENLDVIVETYAHPKQGAAIQLNPNEYALVLDQNKALLGAIYLGNTNTGITDRGCLQPPDMSGYSQTPDNPK